MADSKGGAKLALDNEVIRQMKSTTKVPICEPIKIVSNTYIR